MTSERLLNSFIPPKKKKLLYPQNKFLATPLERAKEGKKCWEGTAELGKRGFRGILIKRKHPESAKGRNDRFYRKSLSHVKITLLVAHYIGYLKPQPSCFDWRCSIRRFWPWTLTLTCQKLIVTVGAYAEHHVMKIGLYFSRNHDKQRDKRTNEWTNWPDRNTSIMATLPSGRILRPQLSCHFVSPLCIT